MDTSLDHLPEHKRDELRLIADFLSQQSGVEMVILFGSYARGTWVEERADDGVHFKYQSDYDLLVVLKDAALADRSGHWLKIESDARRLAHTPVTLITHDIDFVNRRLRKGQYFFSDIQKEGVLLYDTGHFKLDEPKECRLRSGGDWRRKISNSGSEKWTHTRLISVTALREAITPKLRSNCTRRPNACMAPFSWCTAATNLAPTTSKHSENRSPPSSPDSSKLSPWAPQTNATASTSCARPTWTPATNPVTRITQEDMEWLASRAQYLRQLAERLCRERIEVFDARKAFYGGTFTWEVRNTGSSGEPPTRL